jgi:hypothetical protein
LITNENVKFHTLGVVFDVCYMFVVYIRCF